jgi:hypothetical protein
VDYVSVDNTVEQILVTGDKIKFNRVLSGNIPYNPATGNFTLTAGKTYRLTGLITLDNNSSGSNEISSVWKNANGDNLSALGLLLSVNFNINGGGQGVTDVIYTPTSNTTVSLVAQYVGGTTSKTRSNFVSANIQQIGSSAAVYPWTLAGTNTYNTIGNVGIGTTTPSAKLEVNGDVKITGKINLTDPTGNVVMKSAEIVNRGTDVTLGNLKVRFAASGNMSLQISTVAGTYSLTGSSSYVSNGLNGSSLIAGSSPLPISTTPVYLTASTNLSVAGDTCTWLLYDPAAGLGWRIFAIVGVSNANNMVTVERVL